MEPAARNSKTFDCVEFKREAQQRIHEATRDMTAEQRREYLRRIVEVGPLSDFWRELRQRGRQAPKRGRL